MGVRYAAAHCVKTIESSMQFISMHTMRCDALHRARSLPGFPCTAEEAQSVKSGEPFEHAKQTIYQQMRQAVMNCLPPYIPYEISIWCREGNVNL